MKIKVILLVTTIFLFANSCKQEKNTPVKKTELNKSIDSVKSSKPIDLYLRDKDTLKLPVEGGQNLMNILFAGEIESQELKFSADKLKAKLCNYDYISYYSLPMNNNIKPIIIPDECGDNNTYILATYNENEIIDFLKIYSYWEEMSDEFKEEKVTDFKILQDYKIVIFKKEYINSDLKKEMTLNYKINEKGIIERLN